MGGTFGPFIALFQMSLCGFSEPQHVLKHGLRLKGFWRWEGINFVPFWESLSVSSLILLTPSGNCQGGSAHKDNCKQTKLHHRKVVLGSPLQIFWVGSWWQHWAQSQVREEPSLTERSQWPGRPRQRGALEGWKGSGAEKERHICCTAGHSVGSRHCGLLQTWRGERVRGL